MLPFSTCNARGPGAAEQRGDLAIVGLGRGHQASQLSGPDQLVKGVGGRALKGSGGQL